MIFTDEEMKIVLLVAVYGRQEGLDKLRQLRIDNVPQDMKDLHASVIGKMEKMTDGEFAAIDFVGFLESFMEEKY